MKLIKNTIYNLGGLGLPLVVAVFCIPVLIRELGEARFGLLTLIWAVVSYFGLFDLGLGRALTQLLAVAIAEKDEKRVGSLVATATVLMAALGVFAGILMALLAPWGVGLIQSVPDRQEAINSVLLLALAMPAILLTSGFRGVLEARHAFGIINAIRLPMGIFTFMGPVLVVLYGRSSLYWIAAALVIGRVIACIVHGWYAWRSVSANHGEFIFRKKLIKPLCVYGGWLTVSNIISPIMSFADRFIVGALLSSNAVAYYATPQEIVSKLGIIPSALTTTLFPRFSTHFAKPQSNLRPVYFRSILYLALLLIFPVVGLSFFGDYILSVWISPDFSSRSSVALVILSWGMFVACLATIPFTVIQSAGNAKITAFFHVIELPVFIGMLYGLIGLYGIVGAAFAWAFRNLLDAAFLFYYANRYVSAE